MKNVLKPVLLLSIGLQLMVIAAIAQPPPGGPRGPMDPTEMFAREKQNIYKEITDLTDDQKLLIDGIYDEFAVSFKETFEEVRQSGGGFDKVREKMQALRKEKDGLMADVLNEKQYTIYSQLMENSYKRRNREGNNPPAEGTPPGDQ